MPPVRSVQFWLTLVWQVNEHGAVEESLLFHGSSVEAVNMIVEDGWTSLEAGGVGGGGSLLHSRFT